MRMAVASGATRSLPWQCQWHATRHVKVPVAPIKLDSLPLQELQALSICQTGRKAGALHGILRRGMSHITVPAHDISVSARMMRLAVYWDTTRSRTRATSCPRAARCLRSSRSYRTDRHGAFVLGCKRLGHCRACWRCTEAAVEQPLPGQPQCAPATCATATVWRCDSRPARQLFEDGAQTARALCCGCDAGGKPAAARWAGRSSVRARCVAAADRQRSCSRTRTRAATRCVVPALDRRHRCAAPGPAAGMEGGTASQGVRMYVCAASDASRRRSTQSSHACSQCQSARLP